MWPILVNFGLNISQVRPPSVEMRPSLARSGPAQSNIGRILAKLGRSRANLVNHGQIGHKHMSRV